MGRLDHESVKLYSASSNCLGVNTGISSKPCQTILEDINLIEGLNVIPARRRVRATISLHIKSGDGNINAYSYLPSQRRSPCATFSSYRR